MIQGAVIADTGDEQLHMVSLGSTYCLTGRSVSAATKTFPEIWGMSVVGRKCEYRLQDRNVCSCGKHDIQIMDVERQVFPKPDIPG